MSVRASFLVAIALLVPVTGCAGPQTDAETYQLSGTFTENATQEQMSELAGEVEARGGILHQLESFPVQFKAENLTEPACEEIEELVGTLDYVAEHGTCEARTTGGGDEGSSRY